MGQRFWGASFAVASAIFLALSAAVPTLAEQGAAISSGFRSTDTDLVQGSLVSTLADDATAIELATLNSSSRLVGVVSSAALIKLAQDQTYDVQVVTGGSILGLVSDINGNIRAGDKITISPIDGVGMLATDDGHIVGTALQSFDFSTASERQVLDKNGATKTIHIGATPIQVSTAYYIAPTNQFIPPFLNSIANDIAGRPVSTTRIVLAMVLLLLAFSSILALIYTSVKAGMISLGRNPLAAKVINRGFVSAAIITLLIMSAAALMTYLVLTF